jgi:hypothetical protein
MSLYPIFSPEVGLTEFPTLSNLQWRHRADTNITGDPSVTVWGDMEGGADLNVTDGAGSATSPQLGATSGPNGTPAVTFDGVNNVLAKTGITAVAGSTFHVFIVAKQISWTRYEPMMSYRASGYGMTIGAQDNSSPEVTMLTPWANYVHTISSMAIGEWHLYQALFINTSSSFAQLDNESKVSGTASGNVGDLITCVMCADDNPIYLRANMAIAEHVMVNAEVSGDDLTQLMAYFNDRYALWT